MQNQDQDTKHRDYSCYIHIRNRTSVDFTLTEKSVSHGKWASGSPPKSIKANTVGLIELNDNFGFHGSKGRVAYQLYLPEAPTTPVTFSLKFSDPYNPVDDNYLRAKSSDLKSIICDVRQYSKKGHRFTATVDIRSASDDIDGRNSLNAGISGAVEYHESSSKRQSYTTSTSGTTDRSSTYTDSDKVSIVSSSQLSSAPSSPLRKDTSTDISASKSEHSQFLDTSNSPPKVDSIAKTAPVSDDSENNSGKATEAQETTSPQNLATVPASEAEHVNAAHIQKEIPEAPQHDDALHVTTTAAAAKEEVEKEEQEIEETATNNNAPPSHQADNTDSNEIEPQQQLGTSETVVAPQTPTIIPSNENDVAEKKLDEITIEELQQLRHQDDKKNTFQISVVEQLSVSDTEDDEDDGTRTTDDDTEDIVMVNTDEIHDSSKSVTASTITKTHTHALSTATSTSTTSTKDSNTQTNSFISISSSTAIDKKSSSSPSQHNPKKKTEEVDPYDYNWLHPLVITAIGTTGFTVSLALGCLVLKYTASGRR